MAVVVYIFYTILKALKNVVRLYVWLCSQSSIHSSYNREKRDSYTLTCVFESPCGSRFVCNHASITRRWRVLIEERKSRYDPGKVGKNLQIFEQPFAAFVMGCKVQRLEIQNLTSAAPASYGRFVTGLPAEQEPAYLLHLQIEL
ncbi:uncharacterized protein ACN2A1_012605 isoform 1-T1 [Glossina fuscipes fuscipes]